MHEQCVFETVAGPEVYGARHEGMEAVRKAFESAWLTIPDAQWRDARVWVKGDQGVMESTFAGTAADGARIEANMVDLLVFRDGKILRKNAFRKQRPPIAARA
jgi:ketosteroid isomerase-like protein